MMKKSMIGCPFVIFEPEADWAVVEQAFGEVEGLSMGQGWWPALSDDFEAAEVRVGRDASMLHVYACLTDLDIFNPMVGFNDLAFRAGDVFEVFLRPVGQEAYCEFHVSPNNQQLQLRFPSGEDFRGLGSADDIPPEWFGDDRGIKSRVLVEQEKNRWFVLLSIPFASVQEAGSVEAGVEWLFSFSRYDYTRGNPDPVISSTSPHEEQDFHQQSDWGLLQF